MMAKTRLMTNGDTTYRLLEQKGEDVLVIDYRKKTMPVWITIQELAGFVETDTIISEDGGDISLRYDMALAHQRFAWIAPILSDIGDKCERSLRIRMAAEENGVSQQTIRKILCEYLASQDIRTLAEIKEKPERELTQDEKNMRWALNKFYYNNKKWSLERAYQHLLKERYTDREGKLLDSFPSIYQFRYFMKKTESQQKTLISRNGLKDFQKNHRPLLGDGVQDYCTASGYGMLDATVCDIYLVNEEKQLVGRPVLVAAVDGYSGFCTGYSLGWEGGTYSLRSLMLNVLEDKAEVCRPFGIEIGTADWPCSGELPGTLITDMGSEYTSGTFEQITELGVTIVNLPAYRPDLKGPVEKFFDSVQSYFKDELKGKGVIEPDFQERGAHDYRKDACLTMREFETVLLRCILYYNTKRIVEDFPYTKEMVEQGIKPFARDLYMYGKTLPEAHEIPCSKEELVMTLLPRTMGRFSREGLKVNGLRYRKPEGDHSYDEYYLRGGSSIVAYNPDDVTQIWLIEGGEYIPFWLIEQRFTGMTEEAVDEIKDGQRALKQKQRRQNLQAKIDLISHIQGITGQEGSRQGKTKVTQIRETRQKERDRRHKNYAADIRVVDGERSESKRTTQKGAANE